MYRNSVHIIFALVGLLVSMETSSCRAQRSAKLSPRCSDAVWQATDVVARAEYRPEGILGYDQANDLLWDAGDVCRSHGDIRLYNASRHMLSLARSVEGTRLRVARDLSAAGNVDAGASWGLALDDPRLQTVTSRASGCQNALLAAVKDRQVTVRIAACDLKAYD